jgi:hypothetical protein
VQCVWISGETSAANDGAASGQAAGESFGHEAVAGALEQPVASAIAITRTAEAVDAPRATAANTPLICHKSSSVVHTQSR